MSLLLLSAAALSDLSPALLTDEIYESGGLLGPQPLPWAVFPRPTPAWQGMKKGYTIPPTHTQCKITCKLEPCIGVTPSHNMQTIPEPSG